MPSSTPNLSNPQHTIDETKQYNRVVFQQGKPVLDTDLNDLSGLLLAQTAGVISEKLGFGPPQLNYREWAIVNALKRAQYQQLWCLAWSPPHR